MEAGSVGLERRIRDPESRVGREREGRRGRVFINEGFSSAFS